MGWRSPTLYAQVRTVLNPDAAARSSISRTCSRPRREKSAPKEPIGTRAACSTSVYVFQPTTLYSAGGHPTTKRVPLTRTNASRSCRAMPPKDRAERSSFGGDETFRLGSERSTAEAAVARSTVAAAPARWRRCCASSSQPTMAASSAVSFPPYPATEGACCASERTRGASSGDASAASARLASTAKSASATTHAEVPRTPPGVRGPREATAIVATMLGVCSVCVDDASTCARRRAVARARTLETCPRPPSRCRRKRTTTTKIFLTRGSRATFGARAIESGTSPLNKSSPTPRTSRCFAP